MRKQMEKAVLLFKKPACKLGEVVDLCPGNSCCNFTPPRSRAFGSTPPQRGGELFKVTRMFLLLLKEEYSRYLSGGRWFFSFTGFCSTTPSPSSRVHPSSVRRGNR